AIAIHERGERAKVAVENLSYELGVGSGSHTYELDCRVSPGSHTAAELAKLRPVLRDPLAELRRQLGYSDSPECAPAYVRRGTPRVPPSRPGRMRAPCERDRAPPPTPCSRAPRRHPFPSRLLLHSAHRARRRRRAA